MEDNPDLSWATVFSRGLAKKVINAHKRSKTTEDTFKLIPEVIYEDNQLKSEILTRKATSIL